MLTYVGYLAQAFAIAALMYRQSWRTVPVLFYVESLQACMTLIYLLLNPHTMAKYNFWHDCNKFSVLLYLIVFAAYISGRGPLLRISCMAATVAFLTLGMYSSVSMEYELTGTGVLHWETFGLSALLDFYVAFIVYTRGMGNPHLETVWNTQRSIPNTLTRP